jgi:hypothetical protein
MRFGKALVLFVSLFTATTVTAQSDSLQLGCPLANGTPKTIRASDKDYQSSSEYGVMITSKIDTVALAVHDASVVIVKMIDNNNRWDVVLQYRGYYFWYAGILSPKVRSGAKIKAGDVIGGYKQGEMLELLMFYQEEPVNPRKYLKCK